MRAAGARQAGAQHLLGAGLAGAAGDSDDARIRCEPGSGGTADALQRVQGVVDADQWAIIGGARVVAADQSCGSTARKGRRHEGMAVTLHLQRHENIARGERAGVDGETGDRHGGRAVSGAVRGPTRSSQPQSAVLSHSPVSRRNFFQRRHRGRRKGSTVLPTIWPVSWPLPATNATSPAPDSMRTRHDSVGTIADLKRAGRRDRSRHGSLPAARCAGLSSVTMTMSALSAAMRPMIGRLPLSRSPPQPKTQMRRPEAKGRSASSAAARASGLCA